VTVKRKRRAGGGRKSITTKVDRDQVYKLASLNVSVKDIADVIGVSKKALELHYLDTINKGRANLRASVLRKQYEVGVNDGNVTMLIWMGKQHCGQRDQSQIDLGVNLFRDSMDEAMRIIDGAVVSEQ
jgi:hypothetical protein